MNIICLDFDDCILPNPTFAGLTRNEELSYSIFENNIKIIKLLCEKYNMKIFIT
jgi:hypothetical protein